MSAHVLLNLINELGKRDKIRGFSQRKWHVSKLKFDTNVSALR